MNYKTCTGICKRTLPATTEFFHKQKGCKFGLKAVCKVCRNEDKKTWGQKNSSKVRKYSRYWRECNEKHLIEYRENNKEEIRQRNRKYRENNRDKINALEANYRARKLNQTPYLTQEEKHQIELIYRKSQELGQAWQVDHIQPLLKGGVHHPDNLQIVAKEYNLQKGSKSNFRLPFEWEICKQQVPGH